MIAICISNKHYPVSLEVNKEYKVIKEENDLYLIEDETLEEYFYPKELFKIIN